MSDKFFTFMIVPERSEKVKKITLPTLYLRLATGAGALLCLLSVFFFFDYIHVLSQVAENKRLRTENHLLKMDVQSAKTKLETLDQSVGRLRSFAQKLRVLGNLDQPGMGKLLATPAGGAAGNNSGFYEDEGSIGAGGGGQIPNPGSIQVGAPTPGMKKGKSSRPGEQGPSPTEVVESGATQNEPGEDSGYISDPKTDAHARLEYQRSLTMLGELGAGFETASSLEQMEKIHTALDRLGSVVESEEQNFALLQEELRDQMDRLLHTPSILPAQGWITSGFGYRNNPFVGVRSFHAGMDIANQPGTPIYAPADGLITFAGMHGGFGLVIVIDHGYDIVTKYGHNSKTFVKQGQKVRRGDKIAAIGNSGRSTGPHLHYQVEVRNKPVNPMLFILEDAF